MTRIAPLIVTAFLITSHGTANAGSETKNDADTRSATVAVVLSVVPTIISAGMFGAGLLEQNDDRAATLLLGGTAGLIVSPSIGHWYGSGSPFTVGSAIRYVGTGAMTVGLVVAALSGLEETFGNDGSSTAAAANILLYGGMAAVAVGAIYDIATVHGATERANRRRAQRFQLAPTTVRTPQGQPAIGFGVSGTF